MTVREKLKRAFDDSDLTYEQFARLAGITTPSAHRKLNGVTPTTIEEAERYAKILKLKISATLRKRR